jgi:protein-S-isoprenylcysteine O-methyltransferase Ste14
MNAAPRPGMLARVITTTAVWFLITAALLFVPAGTVEWPAAWVFLVELWGPGLAVGIWLARRDPQLLKERMGSPIQHGQERWDKVFIVILLALWIVWLPLMALDAVRYHASHVPFALQGVGALLVLLSHGVIYRTFRENTFGAPVVRIQTERGHRVVTTGPYRYVRHPMYAGGAMLFFGTPLLLGSWWGLALGLVLTAMLAIRAVLEERTLAEKLDGYVAYAADVRYRLIPLVW